MPFWSPISKPRSSIKSKLKNKDQNNININTKIQNSVLTSSTSEGSFNKHLGNEPNDNEEATTITENTLPQNSLVTHIQNHQSRTSSTINVDSPRTPGPDFQFERNISNVSQCSIYSTKSNIINVRNHPSSVQNKHNNLLASQSTKVKVNHPHTNIQNVQASYFNNSQCQLVKTSTTNTTNNHSSRLQSFRKSSNLGKFQSIFKSKIKNRKSFQKSFKKSGEHQNDQILGISNSSSDLAIHRGDTGFGKVGFFVFIYRKMDHKWNSAFRCTLLIHLIAPPFTPANRSSPVLCPKTNHSHH